MYVCDFFCTCQKIFDFFFLHLPNEFKIELCFCNPPDFKSMCHHRLELVWKKPWTKFPTLQFISYDRFWSFQTHSIEIDEKKTHTQQIHETNRKTTEIRFESNIDNELKCYAYLVILNSRFARKNYSYSNYIARTSVNHEFTFSINFCFWIYFSLFFTLFYILWV